MRKSTIHLALFSMSFLIMCSCSKKCDQVSPSSPQVPATAYSHLSTAPAHQVAVLSWESGHVAVKKTSMSPAGDKRTTLGLVLYNDSTISTINSNCNSCHNPQSTSRAGVDFSGASHGRSSVHPVTGLEDGSALVARIKATPYYAELFQNAYGSQDVTIERVSDALAQYLAARADQSPEALATDPRFTNPFK